MPSSLGAALQDIVTKETAEPRKGQSGSEGQREMENQVPPALVKGKRRAEGLRTQRGKTQETGEPF